MKFNKIMDWCWFGLAIMYVFHGDRAASVGCLIMQELMFQRKD